jgi:release factor glutamine methyltransferase
MSDWSIQKLLNWICDYFTEKQVDSPRLSAELLLSEVLQIPRINLYTNFDSNVSQDRLDELHRLVKRCCEHEPLAYLIGRTEFYSLDIKVSSDCLIPRPETELLVESAIGFLQNRDGPQLVCDLCTGSGCIAVAIAVNFHDAQFIATDICDAALSIAAKNVENHKLSERIKLVCGDLFDPIIEGIDETSFDLIVCNPPYVSADEYDKLDRNVKDYEPRKALYAGNDGLDVYTRLIEQADRFLKPDGAMMLEIGYNQAEQVGGLLEKTNAFAEIKIETDHADNDRIAIAKK